MSALTTATNNVKLHTRALEDQRSSGLLAVAQKRYTEAIEALTAVVKDQDTELLLALAFAYLQTNDLNRCFLTCQKAIENSTAGGVDIKTARYSKDVLYGVGCEYYKLGECDVANFAFEQVLGLLAERSASPLQYDVTWRLGVLARVSRHNARST